MSNSFDKKILLFFGKQLVISLIDKFFAVKSQLGKRKGVEQYQERKTSVFDYEFPDTAKPKSNSIFGKAFSQIMG